MVSRAILEDATHPTEIPVTVQGTSASTYATCTVTSDNLPLLFPLPFTTLYSHKTAVTHDHCMDKER